MFLAWPEHCLVKWLLWDSFLFCIFNGTMSILSIKKGCHFLKLMIYIGFIFVVLKNSLLHCRFYCIHISAIDMKFPKAEHGRSCISFVCSPFQYLNHTLFTKLGMYSTQCTATHYHLIFYDYNYVSDTYMNLWSGRHCLWNLCILLVGNWNVPFLLKGKKYIDNYPLGENTKVMVASLLWCLGKYKLLRLTNQHGLLFYIISHKMGFSLAVT